MFSLYFSKLRITCGTIEHKLLLTIMSNSKLPPKWRHFFFDMKTKNRYSFVFCFYLLLQKIKELSEINEIFSTNSLMNDLYT